MLKTEEEKAKFVKDLIASVQESILGKLSKVPAEWDGHELRQWIADQFAAETTVLSVKRKREYKSTVLVNNL